MWNISNSNTTESVQLPVRNIVRFNENARNPLPSSNLAKNPTRPTNTNINFGSKMDRIRSRAINARADIAPSAHRAKVMFVPPSSSSSSSSYRKQSSEMHAPDTRMMIKTDLQCCEKSSRTANKQPTTTTNNNNFQSHYSTEISGSSGYYSSNVCSTYSVEDHIYCEPVINVLNLSKPPSSNMTKLELMKSEFNRNKISRNSNVTVDETEASTSVPPACKHEFNENLRVLEISIENLDRHLRRYAKVQSVAEPVHRNDDLEKQPPNFNGFQNNGHAFLRSRLPTIMEGLDMQYLSKSSTKSCWNEDNILTDIDLDSFLLTADQQRERERKTSRISGENESDADLSFRNTDESLRDNDIDNRYKCEKYVNSCPDNVYEIESDYTNLSQKSLESFLKEYEDQILFENTCALLEDVREKIRRLLEVVETEENKNTTISRDIGKTIQTLKAELEGYLKILNRNSEMELRQFCSGLITNRNIVKMTNAFERHNSHASNHESTRACRACAASIRCSSDPNFKMKRKSMSEVFPMTDDDCYTMMRQNASKPAKNRSLKGSHSFHMPSPMDGATQMKRDGEKASILEWHKNKPSVWDMYYGTNRLYHSSITNGRPLLRTTSQPTLQYQYPSVRPESDFTMDLPKVEQLSAKLEKEKQFRQKCRFLTTFLSLMVFLLTIMFVSLGVTRGKRLFGSVL